jgi:hypothetical protein
MSTASAGGSASERRALLGVLGQRVRDARAAVHEHRHGPVGSVELADARRDLLRALQEYTAALEQEGLPVPRTIRMELRLHGRLFE